MGYCKFCGKELESDGTCTCAEFVQAQEPREKIKADAMTEGKAKKILIIAAIVAGVVLIGIIALAIMNAMNAYKKPIELLAKGINKADTLVLMDSMYTEDDIAEIKVRIKDKGMTWEDFIKENDKTLKLTNSYVGRKHIKAKVVAKEQISGSNLSEIENFYEKRFEADVKKAYRVEVHFTMKECGEKVEHDGWLCVVKLKDGGWKYSPEFCNDRFEFIESPVATIVNK